MSEALDHEYYNSKEAALMFSEETIPELTKWLEYRKMGASAIQDTVYGKEWLDMVNNKIKQLLGV